ncbi:dephospho-CoA kinase [Fibrella aquatica]|uniref:dephospho-CoA kinase n=1 Tax=Fibrella aquatica TaxID=3242487 RepID=UPI003520198B
MKKIGVTGGIGSGKSTVCRVFGLLGIPVYVADDRAKWLTEHDPILRADIVRLLGRDAYDAAGHYNRAYVAAQVFNDSDRLSALNALIHPRVLADTVSWMQQQSAPYVVKEAALMKAAGDQNDLNAVIVVMAPLELRVNRIRQRDPQRSEMEIRSIINRQISDEARLQLADFVLHNDEETLLIPQVLALHERFKQ